MFQKLCISEADRLCKAYTDAWTFARNNWYPSSFRLDWSGLPKDWPCSHLTDDEWSTLLNASANRMRNTGFILAVIRCLPESIQNTSAQFQCNNWYDSKIDQNIHPDCNPQEPICNSISTPCHRLWFPLQTNGSIPCKDYALFRFKKRWFSTSTDHIIHEKQECSW